MIRIKNNKLEGYFSRAISELEHSLNFTLDVAFTELEFGIFNTTTKSWNGAIRLVASGEADIGIADFSMTNTRLDYVDFMIPILTLKKGLYFKQPDVFTVKWFAYYKVYKYDIANCTYVVVCTFKNIHFLGLQFHTLDISTCNNHNCIICCGFY